MNNNKGFKDQTKVEMIQKVKYKYLNNNPQSYLKQIQ